MLALDDIAALSRTPREQAKAAYDPAGPFTVDQLEDMVRAERGLPPIQRKEDDQK